MKLTFNNNEIIYFAFVPHVSVDVLSRTAESVPYVLLDLKHKTQVITM